MGMENLKFTTMRWRSGEMDDASYATLYLLHWQSSLHGKRFASRRRRTDPPPDPAAWLAESSVISGAGLNGYLLAYLERYQFFGIIGNVPVALACWLRKEWPLAFCERIPSPLEVLRMQVEGIRPVTVLSAWPRLLEPVLTKPNGFAFMLHDLEHAWKFYHCPKMHLEQRGFFHTLLCALERGCFDGYLLDPVFAIKFDYLSSDMNTHIMHASQFLRAILMEFHLRKENVKNPEALSREAREEVSALLVGLLGADWVGEVERRMVQQNKPACLE